MTIPYTDHVHGTPPSEHDTSPEWEVAFSVCLFRDREPPGLLRGKGGDTVVDAIGWSQQRQLPSITNGFASHPLECLHHVDRHNVRQMTQVLLRHGRHRKIYRATTKGQMGLTLTAGRMLLAR